MNIAISNIAWNFNEEDTIAKILHKYNIEGIEIAPTKIWNDPTIATDSDILSYKNYWGKKNIKIIAMQSLLFGHPELTIFENEEKRNMTIKYLRKIIRVASLLGVKAMVFGSPKNRIIGDISQKESFAIAHDFFSRVGDIAKQHDIHFCIEANPKVYGTDFLTTTNEVIKFIHKLNHSHINVHLDTGAMLLNKENVKKTINAAQPFYHFHISEPNLLPVPNTVDHRLIAKTLSEISYSNWTSIEMRSLEIGSNVDQVNKTLAFVTKTYRS